MAEKDKKKVTQWAIVAGIVAIIIVLFYLAKKKKAAVPVVEGEIVNWDDPYNYLTYNLSQGGYPTQSANRGNVTIGPTNINIGGGSGSYNPCGSGNTWRPLPPANTYNVTLPPPPVQAVTGGGSDTYTPPDLGDLPEYTTYKCDSVQLLKNMKAAAEMQGIDYQTLIDQNMYTHSEPVLVNWLNAMGLPHISPIGGLNRGVDVFFEPYSNKSIKGKPVKYNVQMACECKRGNTAYCGQYLTKDLLALEDATAPV